MKLQCKHQPFQAEAARAVCEVFAEQPYRTPTYRIDPGTRTNFEGNEERIPPQNEFWEQGAFTGHSNEPSRLDEHTILENIR
jgi:type III restriction enzyme